MRSPASTEPMQSIRVQSVHGIGEKKKTLGERVITGSWQEQVEVIMIGKVDSWGGQFLRAL